nr:hypothetical protein [Tanacetum cinerariifolium]
MVHVAAIKARLGSYRNQSASIAVVTGAVPMVAMSNNIGNVQKKNDDNFVASEYLDEYNRNMYIKCKAKRRLLRLDQEVAAYPNGYDPLA